MKFVRVLLVLLAVTLFLTSCGSTAPAPKEPEALMDYTPKAAADLKAPTYEEATAKLKADLEEVRQSLSHGYQFADPDSKITLYGEDCSLVNIVEEDGTSVAFCYAVGERGSVYYLENDGWIAVNGPAFVYSQALDNLFYVSNLNDSLEYAHFSQDAAQVATPVVGLEENVPILVVALKDGLQLRIELVNEQDEVDYLILDSKLRCGETLLVDAALSEHNSPVKITAEFEGETGVWYANYQEGGYRFYDAYISGVAK